MTVTVTKGKGLWSIARENGVKVSDLYKANPGLEGMQKKGTIPSNHKIEIPTKSKTSTPKPKPKSTAKKTVKKSSKKKPKTQVCRNSKGKILACKKCGEYKNTWDSGTNKRIKLLHPKIRSIAYGLINKIEKDLKIKVRITTGYRTIAEQNRLYAQGRTTPGNKVTTVKGGRSIHNYGLAIDIVEIKNSKANWDTKWKEFAVIGKACGFQWGGDWKKFKDKPHFQKTFGYSSLNLLRKAKRNEYDKDGYIVL